MAEKPTDEGVLRARMVEEQIVRRGLHDANVLAAMHSVPRHLFVPAGLCMEAYADFPLPIGLGQTISQPFMVASMTALLRVDVRSKVLEVGAGSGYQSAVLGEVAGEVFALERLAPLAEGARSILAILGYGNVHVAIADGGLGWPEEAPFDGILVAAATPAVPPALLAQLADGGRLVVPLGRAHGDQDLVVFTRVGDGFEQRVNTRCRFVPLVRDVPDDESAPGGGPLRGVSHAVPQAARGGGKGSGAAKAVRVKVIGRVQGVYYRATARDEGERLGLRGWVRNEEGGDVALHVQGEGAAVNALLDWCRTGPPAARVHRVEVADAAPDGMLSGFEVR